MLKGSHNFRSLAGLPAADGRKLGDRLLRSDHLCALDAGDWACLDALGLRAICDLRSRDERQRAPTAAPPALGLRGFAFDIRNDVRADPALMRRLLDDPTEAGGHRLMLDIYRGFPSAFAECLPGLFALLEDDANLALLLHCAVGKDRTGFAVAMLLGALGVPFDALLADYLRSASGLGIDDPRIPDIQALFHHMTGTHLPARVVAPILDARADYLAAAFDTIRAGHGSAERYLERVAGLDAARVARLRDRLLVA